MSEGDREYTPLGGWRTDDKSEYRLSDDHTPGTTQETEPAHSRAPRVQVGNVRNLPQRLRSLPRIERKAKDPSPPHQETISICKNFERSIPNPDLRILLLNRSPRILEMLSDIARKMMSTLDTPSSETHVKECLLTFAKVTSLPDVSYYTAMTPTPTSLEDLLARITGLRVKARTFAQETLRTPALRRIEYVKQLGYTDPIEALLCFRENTDTLRTALDTAIGSKNYRGRFFQTTGIRTAELEQFCRHKGIFFTKEGVFAAVRKILPTKAISKKLPRWSKFFELKKD